MVVFDTLGQYREQARGFIRIHDPNGLKLYMRYCFGPEGRFKDLRVLYIPLSSDLEKHFEAVTSLVLAFGKNGQGVIYAVDEIDRFCTASHVPPSMKDVINYGRHRKVSMICTSRRPAAVARELTSQCAEIRVFRTTEPRDIRYFADIMGDTAAAQLAGLEEYKYLRWTDDCAEPQILGGRI